MGAVLRHADRRTEMTKLIRTLRHCANAPKNVKHLSLLFLTLLLLFVILLWTLYCLATTNSHFLYRLTLSWVTGSPQHPTRRIPLEQLVFRVTHRPGTGVSYIQKIYSWCAGFKHEDIWQMRDNLRKNFSILHRKECG